MAACKRDRWLVGVVAGLLIFSWLGNARADGKFYPPPETVPPDIPYQRALILFDGERETLFLQSKYELDGAGLAGELGWVVPLPAVPELASMPAEQASHLFRDMAGLSRPRPVSVVSLLAGFVIILAAVLMVLRLLTYVIPSFAHRRERLVTLSRFFGFLAIIGLLHLISIGSSLSAVRPGDNVEILSAEQVGVFDVQVISSREAADLIDWLNERHFQFADADRPVCQDYLDRGWCFVVARLNPAVAETGRAVAAEGLADPLIMRFPAERPVYPLALTGTVGRDTQLLIYTLSRAKLRADDRLALRFARQSPYYCLTEEELRDWRGVVPEGFFAEADLDLPWLGKYSAALTPESMRTDLRWEIAPDRDSYRESVLVP